jgi:hypothetical protein
MGMLVTEHKVELQTAIAIIAEITDTDEYLLLKFGAQTKSAKEDGSEAWVLI